MRLEELECASFAPHVGTEFRFHRDDGVHPLRLVDATELGEGSRRPGAVRRPFSLVFVGPPELRLEQRIYRLVHDRMGEIELFLVPVQPGEDGPRFEAVFT